MTVAIKVAMLFFLSECFVFLQLVEDWNIDAPSYTFTKMDSEDPGVREFVNGFLRRDRGDEFEGLPIKDVKIFK